MSARREMGIKGFLALKKAGNEQQEEMYRRTKEKFASVKQSIQQTISGAINANDDGSAACGSAACGNGGSSAGTPSAASSSETWPTAANVVESRGSPTATAKVRRAEEAAAVVDARARPTEIRAVKSRRLSVPGTDAAAAAGAIGLGTGGGDSSGSNSAAPMNTPRTGSSTASIMGGSTSSAGGSALADSPAISPTISPAIAIIPGSNAPNTSASTHLSTQARAFGNARGNARGNALVSTASSSTSPPAIAKCEGGSPAAVGAIAPATPAQFAPDQLVMLRDLLQQFPQLQLCVAQQQRQQLAQATVTRSPPAATNVAQALSPPTTQVVPAQIRQQLPKPGRPAVSNALSGIMDAISTAATARGRGPQNLPAPAQADAHRPAGGGTNSKFAVPAATTALGAAAAEGYKPQRGI